MTSVVNYQFSHLVLFQVGLNEIWTTTNTLNKNNQNYVKAKVKL